MMREKRVIRVACLLLGVGLLIVAGAFAACGFSPIGLSRAVSGYEERTKDFVGAFSEVRIREVDASIHVLPSEDGRCSVHYDVTNRSTYHIEIVNDALVVEHERHWMDAIGIFGPSPRLTVYLPRTAYDSLDVQNVSGRIEVEGLELGAMNLSTTSSSIQLTNIQVKGEVALKTVSGRIRLADVSAGDLTAATTSGGIRMEGVDAETLDLHSVSGSIKGTLRSGKQFEASSVSGRVRIPDSTLGAGVCRASTTSGGISISVEE